MKTEYFMKQLLLAFCFIAFFFSAMAESVVRDVVKLKDGSVVKGAIVQTASAESIQLTTIDGDVLVYQLSDVLEISQEEETVADQTIAMEEEAIVENGTEETIDDCSKGRNDAQNNYDGKGALVGATWATTLLATPLFGMIPAFIGAFSEPKIEAMNIPDQKECDTNSEYRKCYTDEAKRIKKKKALKAFSNSTCLWGAIVEITSFVLVLAAFGRD